MGLAPKQRDGLAMSSELFAALVPVPLSRRATVIGRSREQRGLAPSDHLFDTSEDLGWPRLGVLASLTTERRSCSVARSSSGDAQIASDERVGVLLLTPTPPFAIRQPAVYPGPSRRISVVAASTVPAKNCGDGSQLTWSNATLTWTAIGWPIGVVAGAEVTETSMPWIPRSAR